MTGVLDVVRGGCAMSRSGGKCAVCWYSFTSERHGVRCIEREVSKPAGLPSATRGRVKTRSE